MFKRIAVKQNVKSTSANWACGIADAGMSSTVQMVADWWIWKQAKVNLISYYHLARKLLCWTGYEKYIR